MKLTKEELDKWEASGEIKRMSHANIVKGIVNIKHAKQFMSDAEYKEFVFKYKKECEIEDVYELTCAGFWNVATDIVIRLAQGAQVKRFITNDLVLQRMIKIPTTAYSRWFWIWLCFVGTITNIFGELGCVIGSICLFIVVALTKRAFKRKSEHVLTKRERRKIYIFYTVLYILLFWFFGFICFCIITVYNDFC